jgi:uncharacterized protein with PIN domain
MLGSLNRWLRICGFDTKYIQNAPDEELLELVKNEGRVLLTRDVTLFRKASVAVRFGLSLGGEMSRGTECGGSLRSAAKGDVRDLVPSGTYSAYDEFWVCGSCGKVYWRGSHWGNIIDTIDEARRLVDQVRGGSEQDL